MANKTDRFKKLLDENKELVDYLNDSKLFGHLPEELLEQLIPLSELSDHPPGTILLKEGEENDKIFFLIQGEVGIYANNEIIRYLECKGDIFGEMNVIHSKPCTETVVTKTAVTLFSIQAKYISKYTEIKSENLNHIICRIFAMVLAEKLILTTEKAEQYDSTSRQLEQANEELKRTHTQLIQSAKLASLGEMSAGMAHGLNQPLESIIHQVEQAFSIIEHLKSFGNENPLKYKKVDLNQLIRNSFIFISEQLRIRDIEVIKDLSKELPLVVCDPIQIEQALANLLSNARDAMEDSKEKRLIVRSFLEADWVVTEIKDTGCGIPEVIQDKIFDPFFTTKRTTNPGLGLSTSYGIIKDHGGRLEVQSQIDKGSTFRVCLPIADEADIDF